LEVRPYGGFGEKREGGASEPRPYAYLSDDLGWAFSHTQRPHRLVVVVVAAAAVAIVVVIVAVVVVVIVAYVGEDRGLSY
jgi:hypothetical protein